MSQIINGTKNHEFRKYCLKPGVERTWFYRTAPHSALTYICETLPARTRDPGDVPLDENGLGNAEFNTRQRTGTATTSPTGLSRSTNCESLSPSPK